MSYSERELIESINNKNIENFNKNGGKSMYIYKVPEKEEESEKNSISDKLKEVDTKYSKQEYVAPELKSLNLEEMEFTTPSDEDIETEAINSLKEYKDSSTSSIDDKFESKISSISEKAEKSLKEREEDESSINADYEASLKKTQTKNIKKGLAYSSIYENALKEVEGNKEKSLSESEIEYNKNISKLENEKSILEQQKESALTSFDISYAVKLQNKIAGINSEIAKEQEKVAKYNQELSKQEETYIKEQEKVAEAERKEIEKKNASLEKLGQSEISKIKAQEKYDILYEYLSGLSRSDALAEMQNSNFKNELGSYYNLLYAQMLKRKS